VTPNYDRHCLQSAAQFALHPLQLAATVDMAFSMLQSHSYTHWFIIVPLDHSTALSATCRHTQALSQHCTVSYLQTYTGSITALHCQLPADIHRLYHSTALSATCRHTQALSQHCTVSYLQTYTGSITALHCQLPADIHRLYHSTALSATCRNTQALSQHCTVSYLQTYTGSITAHNTH